ncbi:MAG: molybdopterin molybdotransferase MoeA [Magnetococcales bacterium]|nr:molybdopterin molybdotransferase MoeA [Magnetococcales bacterium]
MGDKAIGAGGGMIPFDVAGERILAGILAVTESEYVELDNLLGRILAEDVIAGINVPNHDNSAMDGYAVRSVDLTGSGEIVLKVVFDLAAGGWFEGTLGSGEAIRIMTGAPIPAGADTVVMQEVCRREREWVGIPAGVKAGDHIRRAGEDMRSGTNVFQRGRRLGPVDVGVLASLGIARVRVFRRVRVAVLSTGNEVVEVGEPLGPGQVYNSNRAGLKAALAKMGCEVLDWGIIGDTLEEVEAALVRAGNEADAIISTGGVSVGDYDWVRLALEKRGHCDFWKVAMKPGKPLAYGRMGQAVFLGLPGNPVSALTVFYLLIRPALFALMGREVVPKISFQAKFQGHFSKKHGRREFLRGRVAFLADGVEVAMTGAQGSGILTSLARANAFIVLPEGPVTLTTGDRVSVWMIDDE